MAKTPSTMLPLGTELPSFSLPDAVSDQTVSSSDFAGKPLLVMIICNHCPYVVHIRQGILQMTRDYADQGVEFVAINANSTKTHPQDGPENMKRMATEERWGFPYLFDETQEVAKAFRAACTPEFYLFDDSGKLVYRGQFDDARPSLDTPVTGKHVRGAIDALLAGEPITEDQIPSVGCNVKWHPGNEPDYFG